MNDKELKQMEVKVKRRIGIILAFFSGLGLILLFLLAVFLNQPERSENIDEGEGDTIVSQEPYLKFDEKYPTQNIGYHNHYWRYEIVTPEVEYEDTEKILHEGLLTLWPEFTEDNVLWIAGKHPGTMTYIAENLQLNDEIQVTTPSEYKGRHPADKPDIMKFEIIEKITTDIYANESFETIGKTATELYNEGLSESWLVLQHNGAKEDELILYLGKHLETQGN